MSHNTCKIENCLTVQYKDSPYCYKHRGEGRSSICLTKGCENSRSRNKSICALCYRKRNKTVTCKVVGCEEKRFQAYGRCYKHYCADNTMKKCRVADCSNLRYLQSPSCIEHKRDEQMKLYTRSRAKDQVSVQNKKAWLKSLYGLMLADYNRKLEIQNFQCAICQKNLNLANRGAHVDHDHATLKVRDILCPKCNVIIGTLERNAENLYRYLKYLERHESSETIRLAPPQAGDDIVRSAWRHAESGRNDRITSEAMLLMG